jgi:uncharacterized Zn-binding protein involved in type VI secretion
MRLKILALSFVLTLTGILAAQHAGAVESSPVRVINGTKVYKQMIPSDLVWGSASISASAEAIKFQKAEISSAIDKLVSNGAVKVVKKFVKTSTAAYPDWKSYVPTFLQYKLEGVNSMGKVVATSTNLPSDSANLASRLIYLRQSECVVSEAPSGSLPVCTISNPTPEKYLRAALRTSLGNGQTEDLGGYIYQQLLTCLKDKKPFTTKNGVFDCPSNAVIFGGDRSFKLQGSFATRNYSIVINSIKRTATMTYGPANYSKLALTGTYDSGSVVRFG